jgi:HK97 gp10 family phage protein
VDGVAVFGMDRLLAKLDEAPGRVVDAADLTLHQGAEDIEQRAKDLAPVDAGELRDGMNASRIAVSRDTVDFQMESEAPHTIHVEFGTSDQPAKPMIRPAFDETVPATVSRLKSSVRRALR